MITNEDKALSARIVRGMLAALTLTEVCHHQSKEAGWWNDLETGQPIIRPIPEMIALIHSEISEGFEAWRKPVNGKPRPDDHLPGFDGLTTELADALIRICDMAGGLGLPLGEALAAKLAYNAQRADHRIENRRKDGGKKI